jgi:hypothetical protein
MGDKLLVQDQEGCDIFAETMRRDDAENCIMLINQEQCETGGGGRIKEIGRQTSRSLRPFSIPRPFASSLERKTLSSDPDKELERCGR